MVVLKFPAQVVAVALLSGLVSFAQSSRAEEQEPSTLEIQPPHPKEEVVAEYPQELLEQGVEASVGLRLEISAEGVVTNAEVVESAGSEFDKAAQAAALGALYVPATRGGRAVAALILSRIEFRPPVTQQPEPSDATPPLASDSDTAQTNSDVADVAAPIEEEVVVVEGLSDADRLRQSAEAVTVVETDQAKRESADMGEILARTQGIGVRRQGGLGSDTSFSLNGLSGDQVRFFLDGIPLELAGYPFGIANVPVNLIERIEIYSGVVPVRFGADALGGAVNLVTEDVTEGLHGGVSYEVGSFDTHRVTVGTRFLDKSSGIFTRLEGFLDSASNDYSIDVEVPDERGRLSPAQVHRFHDAYQAVGGSAEVGVLNRPWARRLSLRVFETDYDKEYQHNLTMTVPYGEVNYAERSLGTNLRYEQYFGHGVSLKSVGGLSTARGHYLDVAECVYDWFGRCVRERRVPGEADSVPHDQIYSDRSAFGRVNVEWRMHYAHALRFSLAPTYLTRTGDELRQTDPNSRDPLTAERKLFTHVNGVEYEADMFEDRLENLAFLKQYIQVLNSEEPRPGGYFRETDRSTHRFGLGDSLRYRFFEGLYAKASYEWATRLPRAEEVFGDNAFVKPNLELAPETSHNANLGATGDLLSARWGAVRGGVNAFYRQSENLIVLLGNDKVQSYQNVFGARSMGVELAAGWTSPGEHVVLDGNFTHQDFRNTSTDGTFGDFNGDRIPNRPYLFANASARFQLQEVFAAKDNIFVTWNSRYVHEYFRGWESVGLRQYKQTIDSQLVHSLGFGYLIEKSDRSLSSTLEVQNITDEVVFDYFGVQRPGRAVYAKFTTEL